MGNEGFSLIELMVVIAIVAILAAVALPSYNLNITHQKVAMWVSIQKELSLQSAEYYARTGTYGTDSDLGLSLSDFNSSEINNFSIADRTSNRCGGGTSGVFAVIMFRFEPEEIGLDASDFAAPSFFGLQMIVYEEDGHIKTEPFMTSHNADKNVYTHSSIPIFSHSPDGVVFLTTELWDKFLTMCP